MHIYPIIYGICIGIGIGIATAIGIIISTSIDIGLVMDCAYKGMVSIAISYQFICCSNCVCIYQHILQYYKVYSIYIYIYIHLT